jgi:steroid 5-alpha reductase family enzyme
MITLLGIDAVIVAVLFAVMWAVCLRLRNYGFLDVTWTLSIGLLALLDGLIGTAPVERRMLFTVVGLAWSLRLGLFVLARVLRHHPTEDKRYRSLRQQWRSPGAFLVFFELQAFIALIFSAPFLSAAYAGEAHTSMLEWVGLSIAAGGILGEALADAQAQAFKRRAPASKQILDVGLWRYSRHPNYFFEIITWIGFAIAAFGLPLGRISLACPVLIAYFLLRVTGIPLTEKHSLETHGDRYREYQRRTSTLVPWPPKGHA